MVAKTSCSGFFTDGEKQFLKRIVKYGEPAGIRLYFMQGYSEKTPVSDYDYAYTLIENQKKNDRIILNKNKITQITEDGIADIVLTPALFFDSDNHKTITGSDFLPRIFYFEVYRKKKGAKDFERNPVYTYPEEYGTGSKNDENIIILNEDISLPDASLQETANIMTDAINEGKLSNHKNYFLQLKVAKDTKLNRSLSKAAPIIVGEAIGKEKDSCGKCVCEERIRAFMRMVRECEGTGGEKGYTKLFGGGNFTKPPHNKKMTTHPQILVYWYTKNDGSKVYSSAAGAYQAMGYTWNDTNMKDKRMKYNITDSIQKFRNNPSSMSTYVEYS